MTLTSALLSLACSASNEPSRARSNESPVCAAAKRGMLGAWAECVEVPLPVLETAAGTVVRIWDAKDPRVRVVYALVPPSGAPKILEGERMLDEIAATADATKLAPDKVAQLHAALATRYPQVIRCLPGTNDLLPDGAACPAPALVNGKVEAIVERFPYPGTSQETHALWRVGITVEPRRFSMSDGEQLRELPPAPAPEGSPPPPRVVAAPDRLAKPDAADPATDEAICKLAREKIFGVAECKAWAYPAFDLPAGRLFFVATSGASSDVYALRKPDGTLVVGFDTDVEQEVVGPLIATWDPAALPIEKLLALRLFLAGHPVVIRCLPGQKDELPAGRTCEPPTAKRDGEAIVVEAIVERLPLPQRLFSTTPHDLVRMRYTLTPGGGILGEHGPPIADLGD